MLSQMAGVLRLNDIPLCVYIFFDQLLTLLFFIHTTFSLPIHLSMKACISNTFPGGANDDAGQRTRL